MLSAGQIANRFLEMQLYRNRPLLPNLSGLKLEYAVLQIYCKVAGQGKLKSDLISVREPRISVSATLLVYFSTSVLR
jgi:hypothetical protein